MQDPQLEDLVISLEKLVAAQLEADIHVQRAEREGSDPFQGRLK